MTDRPSDRAIAQALFEEIDAIGARYVELCPVLKEIQDRAADIDATAPEGARCEDCPPTGSSTDDTHCTPCPLRAAPEGAVAVAWQCRARDSADAMGKGWHQCSQTQFDRRQLQDRYEYRALFTTQPSQDAEDAGRLDWVMSRIKGSELRRIGVHTNGGDYRPAIDAAISASQGGGEKR